jgi:hypothetical protein
MERGSFRIWRILVPWTVPGRDYFTSVQAAADTVPPDFNRTRYMPDGAEDASQISV